MIAALTLVTCKMVSIYYRDMLSMRTCHQGGRIIQKVRGTGIHLSKDASNYRQWNYAIMHVYILCIIGDLRRGQSARTQSSVLRIIFVSFINGILLYITSRIIISYNHVLMWNAPLQVVCN